ncbi:hypothetical protein [Solirubrum puertoriconensis]|uniref:Uncharacterized protein n=1 Tax=Solirubrum puertoriconensis TaxID=1751427 RepID=A0A9X0HNM2_SOLP1|nr:hypothetical protein [Solirubrum puertoriconensis]KUG09402.1 hypothetical protein ASU33_16875 [Solirubrum puertoriconensis]
MSTFAQPRLVAERLWRWPAVVLAVLALVWLALAYALRTRLPQPTPTAQPPAHMPVHTLQFRQHKPSANSLLPAQWVTELQHHGCPHCTIACLCHSVSSLFTYRPASNLAILLL